MFHQQVASAADLEWAMVNYLLFAVTFLAQSSGREKHASGARRETTNQMGVPWLPKGLSEENPQWEIKKVTQGDGRSWRLKAERICYSWNEGRCAYHPYCWFRMSVQTQAAKGTTG